MPSIPIRSRRSFTSLGRRVACFARPDLPDDARFVFVPEEFIPRLREGGRWEVETEVIRYVDRGGRVLLLVKVRRVS